MNATDRLDASPLHAQHYADRATRVDAAVLQNEPLARDTYRMRVDAAGIGQRILPGQFMMVRVAGVDDPVLGRAFAVYDVVRDASGDAVAVDFVYLVHGKMTTAFARCEPGGRVELWGPLGNGFAAHDVDHLIMVAGGIGQTPFLALGKEALGREAYGDPRRLAPAVDRVTLCYGVRNASLLAGADDFREAGIDLRVASDDGSVGHHGLVTDLLSDLLAETAGTRRQVVCCGPEPMMQAVAEMCSDRGAPCQVSLETPMACGIGICFSCVAQVKQPDGEWDYKRTCVDGPVFDADKIVW
ncbi:MAG: dihydroorotate dehydrogenase electron transfer subunit [Planctomycetota bacterium]